MPIAILLLLSVFASDVVESEMDILAVQGLFDQKKISQTEKRSQEDKLKERDVVNKKTLDEVLFTDVKINQKKKKPEVSVQITNNTKFDVKGFEFSYKIEDTLGDYIYHSDIKVLDGMASGKSITHTFTPMADLSKYKSDQLKFHFVVYRLVTSATELRYQSRMYTKEK
jgi:hypothetical protein